MYENKIKEVRQVLGTALMANPKNWRIHPDHQIDALRATLGEVGKVGALLAYETKDGLVLLDGHARVEVAPDDEWTVLVLNITSEEHADKILASFDSVGMMAVPDASKQGALLDLLASISVGEESLSDALQKATAQLSVEDVSKSKTSELSDLEFRSVYYEPKNKPNLALRDCVDTGKFDAKIAALNEFNLTPEQKDVLRLFTYRFLKIDFEAVASYYAFCASEEEQKAMERLRLVLVDDGIDGFIEDELLRITDTITKFAEDEDEQ